MITFLVSRQVVAQENPPPPSTPQLHSHTAVNCINAGIDCTCYDEASLKKISDKIRMAETCGYEVREYQEYSGKMEEKAWYSDPTIVVSGVVVGVSFAGVLGYLIGSHK